MDACLRRHVPIGCVVTTCNIPAAAQRRSGNEIRRSQPNEGSSAKLIHKYLVQ